MPQSRCFERAKVELPISYSLIGENWIGKGDAWIVDLSSGGARMCSATDFVHGSPVMLRFTLLTSHREVYVYGRIVMSFFDASKQQYAHGVAFTHISREDQGAIARHVDNVVQRQRPCNEQQRVPPDDSALLESELPKEAFMQLMEVADKSHVSPSIVIEAALEGLFEGRDNHSIIEELLSDTPAAKQDCDGAEIREIG
ncbi:MAG: PilZ domain-containing protein [Candidatus Eremiobacteraeota bacterium]|nr:PilZ domain-containing protein [Candidatus Eremiobacteraeota bacterium]